MSIAAKQLVKVRFMHAELADVQQSDQLVPAIVGNDVETLGGGRDARDQAKMRHAGESNQAAHFVLLNCC